MTVFFREERAHLEAKLEQQRHENMELREQQEAKLEQQRQESTREQALLREQMQALGLISAAQIEALAARLEAMQESKLLSEEEIFSLEDTLADFTEAKASFATGEVVGVVPAVGKAHKLIALSEGTSRDATFARQARRKLV